MSSAGDSSSFKTSTIPAYEVLIAKVPDTEITGVFGPSPSMS